MNLRPVIERELRTSARQITTYYSRLVPGVVLLGFAALVYSGMSRGNSASQVGSAMFGVLNATLFSLIWLFVPLSTADLISREKREDTLGLLLLTPLRPQEVVISKMVSALVSGIMLIVAGVPIIAIPLMLGGITGGDLIRSFLINCSALIGAVTTGVVTSSISERRGRAWFGCLLIGAGCFSLLYSFLVLAEVAPMYWREGQLWRTLGWLIENPVLLFGFPPLGWVFATGFQDDLTGGGNYTGWMKVLPALLVAGMSLLFAWIGVWFAAAKVRGHFNARFLTIRQQKIRAFFTSERFFAGGLKSRRRGLLERNPSAWMVQRKWSARLAKWGWLFLSVFVLTMATFDQGYYFGETITTTSLWLGGFMLVSVLLISATGLQNERDSGALELLLVTHLDPKTFVKGRLQGIYRSFWPAALLIVPVFCYMTFFSITWRRAYAYSPSHMILESVLMLSAVMFFVMLLRYLPMIGLCFSLNRPGILSSCLNTAFFGVILPWLFPMVVFGLGMVSYAMWEGTVSNAIPVRRILIMILVVLFGLQAGLKFAIKKGKLTGFPNIWPAWFVRLKVGWLIPWILPLMVFGFFAAGGGEWMRRSDHGDWAGYTCWHLVAWGLLIFLASGCRRALIEMLEKRTFLNA